METLDKKFEQVLALQQLDKSKAVRQILQEVKSSLFFLIRLDMLHQDHVSLWEMFYFL